MSQRYPQDDHDTMNRYEGTVLVLTHRVALGMDQATRMRCSLYLSIDSAMLEEADAHGNLQQVRYLVCCVNSIGRIQNTHRYQTIIIDEAGLVRQHLVSSCCSSKEGLIFRKLSSLIDQCQCLVLAQADLTKDDIEFYATFKGWFRTI